MKCALTLSAFAAALATPAAALTTDEMRAIYWANAGLVPQQFETFETLPIPHDDGTQMGFTSQGVAYASLSGNPLVVHSPGSHGQFPDVLMPTTSSVLTGNGHDFFEVVFPAPVLALAVDWMHIGRGFTRVTYYTADGFVAGGNAAGDNDAAHWSVAFAVASDPDYRIARMVFENEYGAIVNGGIDNLEWIYAPVPEPSTWALLLAGAALLLRGTPSSRRNRG